MNNSMVFAFNDKVVRTGGTPENPTIVGADVCGGLGIQNPSDALSSGIPEDEKGLEIFDTPGGPQTLLVLKEAGVYRLIFRSSKPEAEKFRKWVFTEVLPAIRKTGRFSVGAAQEPFNDGAFGEAFKAARTGKVQMALLQSRGIGVDMAPEDGPGWGGGLATGIVLEDMAAFWKLLLQLLEAGGLRRECFMARPMRGEKAWRLFLAPGPVLEVLETGAAPWNTLAREDLRLNLAMQKEWLAGHHTMRVGEQVMTVWAFEVRAGSPEAMVKICELLSAQEPTAAASNQ
jgi:prophage antirepressor-like protein